MTVTYGFYNSLNGDRKYNAEQMSKLFTGIITDGVFQGVGGALIVSAQTGMNVSVAAGRAWFNGTWTDNDAALVLTLDPAEIALARIDRIILEINKSDAVRANTIKILKGTPASSPVAPGLTISSTLSQYALANIYIAAGVTSITAGNITNIVGTVNTPFITGIVESVDLATLFAQYSAQFDAWFTDLQNELDSNQATNLQNQINVLESDVAQLQTDVDTINTTIENMNQAPYGTTIEGYELLYVGAKAVTISPGMCYAENGDLLLSTAPIAKTNLVVSPSSWYEVYAYLNAGVVDIEFTTVDPIAWRGTAFSKYQNTARRYLGTVRTDSSGNIFPFLHVVDSGLMLYSGDSDLDASPFRALNGGQATTATGVDLTAVIPITSKAGYLRISSNASANSFFGPNSNVTGLTLNPGNTAPQNAIGAFPLSSSRQYFYKFNTTPTGGAFIDVYGYYFSR